MKFASVSVVPPTLFALVIVLQGCDRPHKAVAFSLAALTTTPTTSEAPELPSSTAPFDWDIAPPTASAARPPAPQNLSPEEWLRAAAAAAWSGARDREWAESREPEAVSSAAPPDDKEVAPQSELASADAATPGVAAPSESAAMVAGNSVPGSPQSPSLAAEPPPYGAVSPGLPALSASTASREPPAEPVSRPSGADDRARREGEQRSIARLFGAGPGYTGTGAGDSTFTGNGAGLGFTGTGAGESTFTGVGAGPGFTGIGASYSATSQAQSTATGTPLDPGLAAYSMTPVFLMAPVPGMPWMWTYPVF